MRADEQRSTDDAFILSTSLVDGDVCVDGGLQLFDLASREEKVPEGVWVAAAIQKALDIRWGKIPFITWWESAKQAPTPLKHLRLPPSLGVHAFSVNPAVCEELRSYLADARNYTEAGYLRMAGTQWPGYSGYPYVHARSQITPLQEKRTCRVQGHEQVNLLLRDEPRVWALVQEVRSALRLPMPERGALQRRGKQIRAMHFLLQDETQQASFSWHSDDEDIRTARGRDGCEMTTVIVSLSEECSGMRVWGCAPVVYEGQGAAVAFPGMALHESLPRKAEGSAAARVVRKVALFFN